MQTIDLNRTHIILFKSPRDIQQITYVRKQSNKTNFLKESYELSTKKQPSGHLLIDLDTKTSDSLHYCSNIVQPGPTIFYLPSSKAVITTLTDERERVMYSKANARAAREHFEKKFLKQEPNSFISFLWQCLLNVINDNVPVNKQLFKNQGKSFQQLRSKETSLEKKRNVLAKKTRTHSSVGIVVLYLLEGRIIHVGEFVLIPKRMFILKKPTKEEIFDNPMYQQKATQLALLQRTNPNLEQNNEKKVQDADSNTDRPIMRTKSSGDATSDADDSEKKRRFNIRLNYVRTVTIGRKQNQESCNYP